MKKLIQKYRKELDKATFDVDEWEDYHMGFAHGTSSHNEGDFIPHQWYCELCANRDPECPKCEWYEQELSKADKEVSGNR